MFGHRFDSNWDPCDLSSHRSMIVVEIGCVLVLSYAESFGVSVVGIDKQMPGLSDDGVYWGLACCSCSMLMRCCLAMRYIVSPLVIT